ncbi:MAG: 23S rRNA (guanosine(2251)-2'-O)-methyltransferase RlmB [Holosporales bacterium]|nr:23S rRNA (guanosine(2251)-2'-O)-methyltransferase RlmB [Holosporales bacterium]
MVLLYGRHACFEALLNKCRVINKIFVTNNILKELSKIESLNIDLFQKIISVVDRVFLDNLFEQSTVHQGIVIDAQPLGNVPLENLIKKKKKSQTIVILDQVVDPQNVGSILRLCRVFEADGIVMTSSHAPKETGSIAKVASGALEIIPRCVVPNLAMAIRKLKEAGFWCIGLTEHGDKSMRDIDLTGKIALVTGNEGTGMRQLTQKLCDFNAFLPTSSQFSTLNATMATAITLYEVFIAQNFAKKNEK